MFKRRLVIICLVLALLLPAAALGQSALRVRVDGWFSISPESGFTVDEETYLGDSTLLEKWLCMIYDDHTAIDVTASGAKGYEGASLADMDDAARARLLEERLSEYALTQAEAQIISRRDGTPFFVFRLSDLEGAYLLAETLQAGSYLRFCGYPCDFSEPTDETLRAMSALLETYEADQ